MYITEEYNMYHLAYNLVTKDNYEVLHINPKTNELWLEKYEKRISKVIRVIHKGFNWKNHLKRDIASVFQRVKAMKGHLIGNNIEIHNVYITDHEPVDSWELLKRPMQLNEKKPLKMKVYYLSEENYDKEQLRLIKQIDSTINKEETLPSLDEQETFVSLYKVKLADSLYSKNKRAKDIFSYGKPHFTYLFIILNILMFLYLEFNGGSMNVDNLIESGAKYNPAIMDGEWWRIISSMFLHIGFLHLLMNMVALYYLGMIVEKVFGSSRFIVIYLLSGISGGLVSFALIPNVSAGASGAIFGLFGALLFFGLIYKKLFFQTMGKSILLILGINIIFGFMFPQIDMGAHIGGLIMGFIAAVVTYLPTKKNILMQIIASIVCISILISLIVVGISVN